jgi:hypothetical protein
MKWMTDWQAVEEDLASVWLNAPDRTEVSDAANTMDQVLKTDPLNVGEAREENTRILIIGPLAILYDVLSEGCRVVVWQLWRCRP